MEKDTQSRKWQLTINNPVDKGFSHERLKEILLQLTAVIYWCMADEIGENGTYHTHLYIQGKGGIRFSTLKKHFEGAHFEMARGTALQNREYVSKTGKWEKDKKSETCVEGTFEEWGEMPVERQGARNDIADLYSMIKQGLTDYQILEEDPSYMLQMDKVERVRQTLKQEDFKEKWRDLEVIYIYGDTGSGKTRAVMEKYGYANVFRITDYFHPYDTYKGQDVVIFEEFRSNFRISDMLNYLDGYPLELPCRYANKMACYTKVYIISNIPLSQQYSQLQRDNYESYLAFLRRIHSVHHYAGGSVEIGEIKFHSHGFHVVPFEEVV